MSRDRPRHSAHSARAYSALATGWIAVALTLGGCATQVPEPIRDPLTSPVAVAQVQAQPERHLGQRVRWGGTILGVNNGERTTEIEVLARPLGRDGAPAFGSSGQGRFIVEVTGFLDPAEYPKDREMTVVGIITGHQTRPVGDYPYVYPIVRAESRHLWPQQSPSAVYGPAYPRSGPWFGPWYDPWYGPFYRPYYGLPRRYWH
jgi:outer membrane lipoprotein